MDVGKSPGQFRSHPLAPLFRNRPRVAEDHGVERSRLDNNNRMRLQRFSFRDGAPAGMGDQPGAPSAHVSVSAGRTDQHARLVHDHHQVTPADGIEDVFPFRPVAVQCGIERLPDVLWRHDTRTAHAGQFGSALV